MRLPNFLTNVSPIQETLSSMEAEHARLTEDAAVRNAQLSVSTADTGLSLWERDYSLPSAGDLSTRRARIRAALAGCRTLTKSELEQLAISVAGAAAGEAEEHFSAYHVTLYALYDSDPPEDLPALKEAVAKLKPAHLSIDVVPALRGQGELFHYTARTGKAHLILQGCTDV